MRIAGLSIFDYIDTLTVEQADASQDAALALDYKQSTRWDVASHNTVSFWVELTEAKPGYFLGVVGHNLGSEGIEISVESKALVGDAWASRLASTTLPDDYAKVLEFDSAATHAFWRVTLTGDNINTYIMQLSIGFLVELGDAMAPVVPVGIVEDRATVYGATENHFTGKKSRQAVTRGIIRMRNLDTITPDAFGLVISEVLTKNPFFYVWDEVGHPDECLYCWIDKTIDAPTYLNAKLAEWSISFQGVR